MGLIMSSEHLSTPFDKPALSTSKTAHEKIKKGMSSPYDRSRPLLTLYTDLRSVKEAAQSMGQRPDRVNQTSIKHMCHNDEMTCQSQCQWMCTGVQSERRNGIKHHKALTHASK